MKDQVFLPSAALKPYISYFWTCVHPGDVLEVMYPSGSIELCIDISEGITFRHRNGQRMQVPQLELLGHWNTPTVAEIKKGNRCLITRFKPYSAALFFPNAASEFTNQSIDFRDIFAANVSDLYDQLIDGRSLEEKVAILESFLLNRLLSSKKQFKHMALMESLCSNFTGSSVIFNITALSRYYGFSERFIQKLFNEWVGITPQKFFAVYRFNRSLEMLRSTDEKMTSIAFKCGYFDQAHFIRDFKSYTGLTPAEHQLKIKG